MEPVLKQASVSCVYRTKTNQIRRKDRFVIFFYQNSVAWIGHTRNDDIAFVQAIFVESFFINLAVWD